MKKPGGLRMFIIWYLLMLICVLTAITIRDYIAIQVARNQYVLAHRRLLAWKKARPLLFYGTCEYSRALIQEMIIAYSFLLLVGYVTDYEYLKKLEAMLNRFPPPRPTPVGLFFYIVLLHGYAKIGSLRKG